MSTKKSLLTYKAVQCQLFNQQLTGSELRVPVGVTPSGFVDTVEFPKRKRGRRILISGITGSGRHNLVRFFIQSLIDMYDTNIHLGYLDARDCEVRFWMKTDVHECRFPNAGTLASFGSIEELLLLCNEYAKGANANAVNVLLIDYAYMHLTDDLLRRFNTLNNKGIHIVLITQNPKAAVDTPLNLLETLDLLCTTRVGTDNSISMYGSKVACGECLPPYGYMAYKYNGRFGVNAVPEMNMHDVYNLS